MFDLKSRFPLLVYGELALQTIMLRILIRSLGIWTLSPILLRTRSQVRNTRTPSYESVMGGMDRQ